MENTPSSHSNLWPATFNAARVGSCAKELWLNDHISFSRKPYTWIAFSTRSGMLAIPTPSRTIDAGIVYRWTSWSRFKSIIQIWGRCTCIRLPGYSSIPVSTNQSRSQASTLVRYTEISLCRSGSYFGYKTVYNYNLYHSCKIKVKEQTRSSLIE
uniref:Uncharacterized protein n=1 Tax=Anopheles melas TaxID=34690 RepID=A0A182TDX9_9DIPT